MKTRRLYLVGAVWLGLILGLGGCAALAPESAPTNTPEPTATPTPEPRPQIVTDNGVLVITKVTLADRYPFDCDPAAAQFDPKRCFAMPTEGRIMFVVWLAAEDGGEPDLSDVLGNEGIYVEDSSGNKASLDLTGTEPAGSFVAFAVMKDAEGLILYWLDNEPIPLEALEE